MRILITGGAGFVGSRLSALYAQASPKNHVVVFDNLKRRGSELNLPHLKKIGVQFFHGDIRNPSDFDELNGSFDLFIECSAEPSVLAGVNSSPQYAVHSNLTGTLHCLEFARRHCGGMIFLSTSRVYSIDPLRSLSLKEDDSRFSIKEAPQKGISAKGITEEFPTHLPRSIYGATKLASELMIQEYCFTYGLKAVINRCGVIAGAGQMGKVDQGFFTLWLARHFFKIPLIYQGFGGMGKQVRDVLHPEDLFSLLLKQEKELTSQASIYNVGGGMDQSVSLRELTSICQQVTGHSVPIESMDKTHSVDIPFYVSDCSSVQKHFDWRPKIGLTGIAEDIYSWLKHNSQTLETIFCYN